MVGGLIEDISADGVVTPQELGRLERQLQALDLVYEITPADRARLERAGLRAHKPGHR